MGELPPNSEVPVTVTIYNNVCGKFDDVILSKVKGLGDVFFPVSISITGSPVRIPPNQVGLNYNTVPPTLPIPTVVAKTKVVHKTFQIKNTGINSVEINWRIFDQAIGRQSTVAETTPLVPEVFDLDIVKNLAFDKAELPYKFEYQAIEPEPSQGSAFKIEPPTAVVGSRSTHQFSISFDPSKGTGNFKSIILASPVLSQEELEIQKADDKASSVDFTKKGSLGIISLRLDATTIDPVLSIDRKQKMDGQNHMRLKYWSVQSEDAPKKIQKLTFTNNSKADLTFNLNITGPFDIVKTKTNSGAVHPLSAQNAVTGGDESIKSASKKSQNASKVLKKKVETMFCLQPLKIVEVHVKFCAPPVSDTSEWPMTIRNEREGELVAKFNNGDQ